MSSPPPVWDDLRILLAVARGKSLLAAGKSLGIATSTVARRLDAFERALGRVVVHRGSGGTTIDAEAAGLVALAEQMDYGLAAVRRGRDGDGLSGVVRITASEGAMRPLVRMLAGVQAQHPGLSLELSSASRLEDLARREADIGLRIVRSGSPSLVEKRVGRMRLAVFAARSYVERRLPSARLGSDEAGHHAWIGLDRSLAKLPSERWMRAYGAKRFVLRASSPTALEEAVIAGMGLGVFGEAHGLAQGLVRIDTETSPPAVDLFVAFHRDARKIPRILVVLRAIEAELRRALA